MSQDSAGSKPEQLYRNVTDSKRRQEVQAAVILTHRDRVRAFVRRNVPKAHWVEGEQVGAIGVLTALEKYDPEKTEVFWAFALSYVRNEIQKWMDYAVYWRPRTRKTRPGFDEEIAHANRHPESVELRAAVANKEPTVEGPTVEELVANAEAYALLMEFAANLSDEDREILFSENSQRVRTRRYLSLVDAATAYVRGKDVCDHNL